MILSAQSIRERCQGNRPMISPFMNEKLVVNGTSSGLSSCSYDVRIDRDLTLMPGDFALANTIEDLIIPHDIAGFVYDKSTYARRGMIGFNTLIDPGFEGNLTLELKNLGNSKIVICGGDAICQIVFQLLDKPTERPYTGKYQFQPRGPQPAIME